MSDTEPKSTKGYGHRRQPALGKAMPVTALLLNFPKHSTKASHMRGGEGGDDAHLSEYERPPLYFSLAESQLEDSSDSHAGETFEIVDLNVDLDRDHSVLTAVGNKRRRSKEEEEDEDASERSHATLLGNANNETPCLTCTNSAPRDLGERASALNEMCLRLCTPECRLRLSLGGFVPPCSDTSTTAMSRLPARQPPLTVIQRKKFLTDLLNASDTDSDAADDGKALAMTPKQTRMDAFISDLLLADTTGQLTAFKDLRAQYEIAEALEKTSAMTSTSRMKQRLAARKLEIELENTDKYNKNNKNNINNDNNNNNNKNNDDDNDHTASDVATVHELGVAAAGTADVDDYVPPRDLLLYLVRMGSFNSAPRINNVDSQDDNLELPKGLSTTELLQHVRELHGLDQPPLLSRCFRTMKPCPPAETMLGAKAKLSLDKSIDITDGLRCLDLNTMSQFACNAIDSDRKSNSNSTQPLAIVDVADNHIRIFQWNILSQSLGQNNDGFVCCPEQALTWQHRKFLIVQEILRTNPDVICLQEVDHFKFLEKILANQHYYGIFFPKPDSPCLYIEENNGPDGCAIFFKRDKFKLKQYETRILEVWRVQSNQVAIAALLEQRATGRVFCVCTTHLKARRGSLLAKLRNEQGRDLIRFVKNFAADKPVILAGDFNAVPTEPIYATILNCDLMQLSSAYADMNPDVDFNCKLNDADFVQGSIKREPPYTTWKIREQGEECHTIDYVFYTRQQLKIKNCLEFPQADDIGESRTPNFQYPSDHFSLVCDFELLATESLDIREQKN